MSRGPHDFGRHLKVVNTPQNVGPLTDIQATFARAYVETGGDIKKAQAIAGIGHETYCYLLLTNPKIIKAIHDETLATFARNAPVAQSALIQLMHRAESESIRFQAACKLLDYAGMQPAQRQELVVTDDRSDKEVLESINSILEALGVHKPITIDGDAEDGI